MPASGTSQTASVLILTITDETPQTRIVLQTPAQRMTELRRIDSQLLRGAVQAVSRALQRGWQRNGGQPGDLKRLRAEGEKLADLIFPNQELSSALTSWDGCFLRIEAPLNWQVVPWELLVLDGQFLCQRTAIGRIVPGLNETARSEFDTIGSPRLVSIPDTGLIAAQREYDAVRRHLRQLAARHPARFQRPECSYMKQTAVDMARCLDGSRWFHFSGHAQPVGETRGWRLAQSGPLPSKTADSPHHLLMPEQLCDLPVGHWPELVVAHACGSAQLTAAPDGPPSMVEAMLRQGVSWYLGTLAPVLDDQCLKFVEPFYSSLTSGVPIGTALHRARTAMREQLPEGNLLWLSYVLYGDPTVDLTTGRDFGPGQSEAPTATFDPLRQPDDGGGDTNAQSETDSRQGSASDVTGAGDCAFCGVLISTRHGIGRLEVIDGQRRLVCRACHAGQATAGGKRKVDGLGVRKPQSQQNEDWLRKAWCIEQNFHGRLQKAVERFTRFRDLLSGEAVPARLELTSEGVVPQSSNLQWSRRMFGAGESTVRPKQWRRLFTLRPVSRWNRVPEIQIEVQTVVGQDRHGSDCDQPVSREQLVSLLGPARGSNEGRHHIEVCASLTGWTAEAIEYVTGTSPDSICDASRSVVLINLLKPETSCRAGDLQLLPFLELFDLEVDGEQVLKALDFIRQQLPLVTSLSSHDVASTTQLRRHAVDTAFHIIAEQQRLRCESVDGFGVVLSGGYQPAAKEAAPAFSAVRGTGSVRGRFFHWLMTLLGGKPKAV